MLAASVVRVIASAASQNLGTASWVGLLTGKTTNACWSTSTNCVRHRTKLDAAASKAKPVGIRICLKNNEFTKGQETNGEGLVWLLGQDQEAGEDYTLAASVYSIKNRAEARLRAT
jgi:hypothetical protein